MTPTRDGTLTARGVDEESSDIGSDPAHPPRLNLNAPVSPRACRKLEFLMLAVEMESLLRRRLWRRHGVQHQDIADLLQDVYLQLLTVDEIGSKPIASPMAYVMTVARNKAYDGLRHQRVVATVQACHELKESDIAAFGSEAEDVASIDQELDVLNRAIDALPLRSHQVFVLHKICGLSYKEISGQLNVSVHTLEQHMTRALLLIDQALQDYGPQHGLLYAVREHVTRFSALRSAQRTGTEKMSTPTESR